MPRMTAAEIDALLVASFPQARGFCASEAIRENELDCVVRYRDAFLRPGGTLSGPTLMTLADTAMLPRLAMTGTAAGRDLEASRSTSCASRRRPICTRPRGC
jgi:acyl-coenzyme A thioesterase PaaI-like protein